MGFAPTHPAGRLHRTARIPSRMGSRIARCVKIPSVMVFVPAHRARRLCRAARIPCFMGFRTTRRIRIPSFVGFAPTHPAHRLCRAAQILSFMGFRIARRIKIPCRRGTCCKTIRILANAPTTRSRLVRQNESLGRFCNCRRGFVPDPPIIRTRHSAGPPSHRPLRPAFAAIHPPEPYHRPAPRHGPSQNSGIGRPQAEWHFHDPSFYQTWPVLGRWIFSITAIEFRLRCGPLSVVGESRAGGSPDISQV